MLRRSILHRRMGTTVWLLLASSLAHGAGESGLMKYWLRFTKHGDKCEDTWSRDSGEWNLGGERVWGTGAPKRIGIITKNGDMKDAAKIDNVKGAGACRDNLKSLLSK